VLTSDCLKIIPVKFMDPRDFTASLDRKISGANLPRRDWNCEIFIFAPSIKAPVESIEILYKKNVTRKWMEHQSFETANYLIRLIKVG
jgi:hypothetical protein